MSFTGPYRSHHFKIFKAFTEIPLSLIAYCNPYQQLCLHSCVDSKYTISITFDSLLKHMQFFLLLLSVIDASIDFACCFISNRCYDLNFLLAGENAAPGGLGNRSRASSRKGSHQYSNATFETNQSNINHNKSIQIKASHVQYFCLDWLFLTSMADIHNFC